MTVHTDNPAGRLHELLTVFGKHASQQAMWQAWAATLQVSADDIPGVLRRVAMAYDLPSAIVSEIDRVPDTEYDREFSLRWRHDVQAVLGASLFATEPAATVIRSVSREALFSLEHCSYLLHRFRPQPDVSDQEQQRIAQMVSELEEAVEAEPGMDPDLRIFLLYHAGQMSRALRDLPLRGRAALEDAFDQAVGAANRRMDLTSQAENAGAWAKFRDLILVIAAILAIASTSLALPGQIRRELEGPPPAPSTIVKVIEQPQAPQDAPSPQASSAADSRHDQKPTR